MIGPLRALVLSLNQAVHGVDATVTRPDPDQTPIATKVIWLTPVTEFAGLNNQRAHAIRVMAISKADVPTVPRDTRIVAPERDGDVSRTWVVDGVDKVDVDHIRVFVLPEPD